MARPKKVPGPVDQAKSLLSERLSEVQREEKRISRAVNALNGKSPGRPTGKTKQRPSHWHKPNSTTTA